MGIRFYCPNGHKLNVKSFQAGRKGICPYCGTPVQIPTESTRKSSKEDQSPQEMAPVQIIGAEPDEPLPPQPATSVPATQSGLDATPTLQPQPGMPTAQPAQPAGLADATSVPSPAPVLPTPTIPTPTVPTPALPTATVPMANQPFAAPLEPAQTIPTAQMAPAVPDPLAEAPDAVWYVRPPGGGQFGPAPGDVMRTWIDEGRVAPEAIVWREGWRDWQEASAAFPRLAPDPTITGLEKIASAEAATSTAGRLHHGGTRRQSNAFNTAIITVLVFAVIVLFAVFVWVLTNQPPP